MPRNPDLPCADCGAMMWRGTTSLPEGQARCQPCRRKSKASKRHQSEQRQCDVCEQAFMTRSKIQRYCSTACHSNRARAERANCEVCDEPFRPSFSGQRTCGRYCGAFLRGVATTCIVPWAQCETCSQWHTARRRHCQPAKDRSWMLRQIECPMCGGNFTNEFTTIAVHCSRRCSRKASKLRRKVRECGSNGTWRWSDFMRIAARFDYCCAYCGEKPERLDPDHVIPLAKGGPNTTSNLLPACPLCNSQKTDMLLSEWAAHRRRNGQQPRATSWADDDPRYFHLTAVRSQSIAA